MPYLRYSESAGKIGLINAAGPSDLKLKDSNVYDVDATLDQGTAPIKKKFLMPISGTATASASHSTARVSGRPKDGIMAPLNFEYPSNAP